MFISRINLLKPLNFNNLTLTPRRLLHSPEFFKGSYNKLVIVGNNAMLHATLDLLRRNGVENYPPIVFICPEFWLDNLHPDYFGLSWGHPLLSFQRTVRDAFLKHYPDYPLDRRIAFCEYQEFRQKQLKELIEKFKVEYYPGEPLSIEPSKQGNWVITFQNRIIEVPKNSFFYSWYRKPVQPYGIQPHTKLYTMPRKSVPDSIILIGHGLSFQWVLTHFSREIKRIVMIERDQKIAEIQPAPSNRGLNIKEEIKKGRLKVYRNSEYELVLEARTRNTMGNLAPIGSENVVFPTFLPVFGATGYRPEHALFKSVPSNQKVLMPHRDKEGRPIAPSNEKEKKLAEDIFTAPQNIPLGSLPHSYTSLMHLTDNVDWTISPMYYFRKSHFQHLRDVAKKFNITLTKDYFDAIHDKIEKLEEGLSDEQIMDLYIGRFIISYSPSVEVIEQFRECLKTAFNMDLNNPQIKGIRSKFKPK